MGSNSEYLGPQIPSLSERLTWNFYAWERFGRGWLTWNYPVYPEPPFKSFQHYYIPSNLVDDGRKPSLISRVASLLSGRHLAKNSCETALEPYENPWSELSPREFNAQSGNRIFAISTPPDKKINIEDSEQFLLNLGYCENPICFEIVGTSTEISLRIVCSDYDRSHVSQQLTAYFPYSVIEEREDDLNKIWGSIYDGIVIDFGLSQEFMRPIRLFNSLDPDPLIGVIGSLSDLKPGEIGVFQVLFNAVRNDWAQSIIHSVLDFEGKPFFMDCPDMVHLASEKISRQLYAGVLRVAGCGSSEYDSMKIARSLAGSLIPFSRPGSNELFPLDNADYYDDDHIRDLLNRQSHRSGMILNSRELVAFAHLPSISVRTPKLVRQLKKTKAAHECAIGNDLIIGDNIHQGHKTQVSLNTSQRLRHIYSIGATGTGKTTFILNLILQDLEQGNGIAVLDPHGDLIDSILDRMPEHRIEDVVLLNPSDIEHPVGFNVLEAHSELEKIAISSDFVEVFKRLSTSWGDQMTSVLGNTVLAFLESDSGGTLADMRRFLIEREFRQTFLKTVKDPDVTYFWEKGFQLLVGKPQGPILTRLDTFLRPKPIRRMVSQKFGLNFQEIMDSRKILLAKLSQGLIGAENAYLLGTLIVSKLHQVAMARQIQHASERVNFFVYIDEFHNFLTKSMADLLSGARKYNLGLILAHQDLRQLWDRDKEVANSVISNPGTRVCFRVGDFDAGKLEDGFTNFDRTDLLNLGVGEAIARIDQADHDFNLKTYPTPQIDQKLAVDKKRRIIDLSRRKYSLKIQPDTQKIHEVEELEIPDIKPEEELVEIKQTVNESFPEVIEIPGVELADLEGSGGSEHRYLQTLIKKLAENLGFRAVIEEQTPDGKGKIDIGLEKSGRRIACEISLTSKTAQEIANIRKCLDAGYNKVIVCSQEKRTLSSLKKLANDTFNPSEQNQLSFLLPQELIFHLEQEANVKDHEEQRIKGWKVKVQYKNLEEDEQEAKREAINKVILDAFQRMKM